MRFITEPNASAFLSVCKVIPFRRRIAIYETRVSAGVGNFLEDGPYKEFEITDSAFIPENASFGVYISGDSMTPDFEDGQIAWVHKQDTLENGEIGISKISLMPPDITEE